MASWDDLDGKNSFELMSHRSGCFGASKGIPGATFTFAELAGFTNSADRTSRPVPPPAAKEDPPRDYICGFICPLFDMPNWAELTAMPGLYIPILFTWSTSEDGYIYAEFGMPPCGSCFCPVGTKTFAWDMFCC